METGEKIRALPLTSLLGGLASVACMGSMGAMSAAASAGAAATSGMGEVNTMSSAPSAHLPFITQLLHNLGLGALTQIPDAVLRPIFISLLVLGVVSSYLAYRNHRQIGPLALTMLASALLYFSIYVVASDLVYYTSLALLLIGAAWNVVARSMQSKAAKERAG